MVNSREKEEEEDRKQGTRCRAFIVVKQQHNVRIELPPVRPNSLTGPCSRALIGGAQSYMVGGPPSHCAIYIGGGRSALGTRLTSATTPHRYSRSRSKRGAASDGKLPPSPAAPPDVTASAISISSESMAPANDPNTGASSGSTTPAPNPAPTDGLRFLSLSLSLLFSDRS
jgi:hypothetical protein